ncbi:hydroxylase [Saccharomonospora sp. CUA-673]|uniref:SDR family oxidoreductase n=1 Tax=Saccharomonospora sp. CUA-673 TaxID=1904969 RepID=UPI0009602C11|nr:NAD(P)H-binding protein [Saccharomonospora sp. CUA-673]OLT48430.1 hydroxylase [Saccharomonospora sp. CUA-673]
MTILVTGATGNIGRRTVDQLLRRGATDIRALTNNPTKAALPDGVEVAEGYLRRLDTLPAAFHGVTRVYLAPIEDGLDDVLRIARDAGVEHVVALTGEPESWWGGVTHTVENSGIPWTHLWPGDFMENAFMWVDQIRRTGEVHEPQPDAASAPTAMDDIAAVAAVALLNPEPGAAYSLTGPDTLTRADQVAHIATALGRDLRFVAASPADTIERLRPTMGENAEWFVHNALDSFDTDLNQHNTKVEEITGEPATTFADWAHANVDAFR